MKTITTTVLTLVACAAAALIYVYSGSFDAAADTLDSALTAWTAKTIRERSIETRSNDIVVPQLDDADMIARGADEYAEMCAGCHLGPGVADNEFRQGLNPPPPELAKLGSESAGRQFWIVKHGLRMTGMPAWGRSHDDATLWSIVAFLKRLPTLTPEQYAQMTVNSAEEHETAHHHDHADEDADD
jgi:mono/diheme cytochrome c family protein